MIKVYAFDFDGVITTNPGEHGIICRNAWKRIGRSTGDIDWDIVTDYRAYTKNAGEWYGVLRLLESNRPVTRESIKEIEYQEPNDVRKFASLFFEERIKLQTIETNKWLEFYKPFEFVVDMLKELVGSKIVYIVSNKDRKSIEMILSHLGVRISEEKIIGKEHGLDKKEHIEFIIEKENISPQELIFIDDSIEHIKYVKQAGVNVVLASWGHVLPEDVSEAKKLHIDVLNENNFHQIIEGEEYFDIVDEDNNIIGRKTRKEVHEKGLWHRSVHVVVMNSHGHMLLQKRSMSKDLYKGYWIDGAAGHLDSGEDYEQSAYRELKEELGIATPLIHLFDFKKFTGNDNEFIHVFGCLHNGPFHPNKEEVDFVKFFSIEEIENLIKTEKFTPATLNIMKELKSRPELLKRLRG